MSFSMIDLGIIIQVYRGASKYKDSELRARLDEWKDAGISGVGAHGFVGELSVQKFEDWAGDVHAKRLGAGAFFGLGPANPEQKGVWMGNVFASLHCDFGGCDEEGAADRGAQESTRIMVANMRQRAPNQFIVDQPWMIPTSHPTFPYAEWAEGVNARFRQLYSGDFIANFGADRWKHCYKWSQDSWATEDAALAKTGHVRPHGVTLQGYKWDDIPWDLVRAIMAFPATVFWCEPWPDEVVLMAIRFVTFLKIHGYPLSDLGVAKFQKDAGIKVDGAAGYATMAAAGIKRATTAQRFFTSVRRLLAA